MERQLGIMTCLFLTYNVPVVQGRSVETATCLADAATLPATHSHLISPSLLVELLGYSQLRSARTRPSPSRLLQVDRLNPINPAFRRGKVFRQFAIRAPAVRLVR